MKLNLLIIILALFTRSCSQQDPEQPKIDEVSFSYSLLHGLEPETGVTRRDPSDVIKVNDTFYLWYTKTEKHYSGYDASIWYAISNDSKTWEEIGEALARGEPGAWDAYSVFTPNILKASGKYYLFYTGVQPTPGNLQGRFENNSENDFTAIGLAEADHPTGPFVRSFPDPILKVSDHIDDFDSYRVDDACLIHKDNKYWLYYKGRSRKYGNEGPKFTKLGVAISRYPEGPYQKYQENPIIGSGHEVLVWPYQGGIISLLSEHGPEGRTLQYAADGIHFKKIASFGSDYPKAPGSFRVDDFKNVSNQTEGTSWGISMFYGDKEKWPHLLRYEISLN